MSLFHRLREAESWSDVGVFVLDEFHNLEGRYCVFVAIFVDLKAKRDPRVADARLALMSATQKGPIVGAIREFLERRRTQTLLEPLRVQKPDLAIGVHAAQCGASTSISWGADTAGQCAHRYTAHVRCEPWCWAGCTSLPGYGVGEPAGTNQLDVEGQAVEILDSNPATMYLGKSLGLTEVHETELRHSIAKAWATFTVYEDDFVTKSTSLNIGYGY